MILLCSTFLTALGLVLGEQACDNESKIGDKINDYQSNEEIGTQLFEYPRFKSTGYVRGWEIYINKPNLPVYVSIFTRRRIQWLKRLGTTRIQVDKAGYHKIELDPGSYIPFEDKSIIGVHYDKGAETGVVAIARQSNPCGSNGECIKMVPHSLVLENVFEQDWQLQENELDIFAQKRHKADGALAVQAITCDGYLPTTPAPPTEPGPASKCAIPFEYKGETYTTCISLGSQYPWCSLDSAYVGKYKKCALEDGDPLPEAMPCYKGFVYDNKKHDTCIIDTSMRPWCVVGPVYNGHNWRKCRKGDPLPKYEACHFPFDYNGSNITTCSPIQSSKPWCSLQPTYDGVNWRYCRNVTIYNTGIQAQNAEEAGEICRDTFGLLPADERDVREAWEIGSEECFCGWVSDGHKVSYVHDKEKCDKFREDLKMVSLGKLTEVQHGVNKCEDGEAAALCIVE